MTLRERLGFTKLRALIARQPPLRWRMIIMLLIVGVLGGLIFGWQAFKAIMIASFLAHGSLPPQTVSTTVAKYEPWQSQISVVGTLHAVNGADLAVEVAGTVEGIYFNSGDDVKAGAVLVRLRANDEIAREQALDATAHLAEITYQRDQKQFKAQAISQAALDTAAADLRSARAQLAAQQAVVAKKVILAPFAGRTGIRAVNVGQYVSAGTPIVTLQALDPIYLDFFLPEQTLSRLGTGQKLTATVDAYPGEIFSGVISAIDPKVDASSRNVQVRATLANPNHKLLPGMYATAEISSGTPQRYITLPQTAITFNPYGSTVYIADNKGNAGGKPQLVARQTFVTTGDTRGDQIAILKGVKEGDVIVIAGQMKLQNGSPLLINNSLLPANNPNPTPYEH